MNIVSFNINGLNAFDGKGNLNKIISETNADIYCFQETKISSAKVDKMNDIFSKFVEYTTYNNICTVKNGYAGVSVLVHDRIKDRIQNISYPNVLENVEGFEEYGDGRLVVIEFDNFYLINAYVVNSGKKQLARIEFDNAMIDFINGLEKPPIYCGDMNVCATHLDYWGNLEKSINTAPGLYEFEMYDFKKILNECQLVDSYRYKNKDKQEWTWYSPMSGYYEKKPWETRHGWRIDYFLVAEELKEYIQDSKIYEGWNKVDHSPIELEINI